MSDLERGIKYIADLWEQEKQKNETTEETKARHRKMAETADLALELLRQCTRCTQWDEKKPGCKIKQECIVNCPDWIHLTEDAKDAE